MSAVDSAAVMPDLPECTVSAAHPVHHQVWQWVDEDEQKQSCSRNHREQRRQQDVFNYHITHDEHHRILQGTHCQILLSYGNCMHCQWRRYFYVTWNMVISEAEPLKLTNIRQLSWFDFIVFGFHDDCFYTSKSRFHLCCRLDRPLLWCITRLIILRERLARRRAGFKLQCFAIATFSGVIIRYKIDLFHIHVMYQ